MERNTATMETASGRDGWSAWDPAALVEDYRREMGLLKARRELVISKCGITDRRLALIDEEIDELAEVLCSLRQYIP